MKDNEDLQRPGLNGYPDDSPDAMSRRRSEGSRYFFIMPTLFGLAAGILVVSLAGLHWQPLIAAALLVAGGVALGRWVAERTAALDRQIAVLRQPVRTRLEELCLQVFPVWSRQLDTSRVSADRAVAQLSDLFGEIVTQLEGALSASMSAVGGNQNEETDVLRAIDRSKSELRTLILSLKTLEESRDAIRGQVKRYATELKDMAAEVQQVAMRLRLVSLNAGIEAARAGEAGKPFAIVTGEMRQLAAQFAETSVKMSKQVEAVDFAVAAIYRDSRQQVAAEISEMSEAEEIVARVLDRFHALTANLVGSVERLEQERSQIRSHISSAIVALQFQDRVSQILSRVHAGLDDVSQKIVDGDEEALDFQKWLTEAKRSYTTSEEFANVGAAIGPATTGPRETTYF